MFLKVLFTGMAFTALVLAQGGGKSGGRGEQDSTPPGGANGMRAQKETKADQIVNRLKLNKEQKTEFESILETAAKGADPVVQQVLHSRNLVAAAMITGRSQAELDVLVKAMNDAQWQMIGVEVGTFQKIVAILKPNQTAKAPEAFDLMADIFVPQGGGMGGGMGRRGGR
jgi:hypothetical protein